MSLASALKIQIESALANRIPSALTPAARTIRPVVPTGIKSVNDLIEGGIPLGAITEIVGDECSGRTALALSFLAQITNESKVCAWIDVSNALHPESAAAAAIDLNRLLWVRCGALSAAPPSAMHRFELPEKCLISAPVRKGLHGGGCGAHPRTEGKGLSDAVSGLLRSDAIVARCAEPQRNPRPIRESFEPTPFLPHKSEVRTASSRKPWSRLDQALQVTDLILQGGGFSAIVLDMGGIAPEYASRVQSATWFRYRAAAERTQASILLLTQHPCSKSAAELVLKLKSGDALQNETTVFSGIEHRLEVVRKRFTEALTNVIPLRKAPHKEDGSSWRTRTTWAGLR